MFNQPWLPDARPCWNRPCGKDLNETGGIVYISEWDLEDLERHTTMTTEEKDLLVAKLKDEQIH